MTSFLVKKFTDNENKNDKRYTAVMKYSTADSSEIYDAIFNNVGLLYFDDTGTLLLKKIGSEKIISNGITKKNNVPTLNAFRLRSSDLSQKYFYSIPYGKYILYIESYTQAKLLYNPIPRNDFIDFYKKSDFEAYSFAIQACVENGGKDPICRCLNLQTDKDPDTEFCMNDIFGSPELRKNVKNSATNKTGYNTLEGVCGCSNDLCEELHPLNAAIRSGVKACPSNLVVTICNSTLNTKDFVNSNATLSQSCSGNLGGVATDATPPPVINPPPSPITQPPPSIPENVDTTQIPNEDTTNQIPTTTQQQASSKNTYKFFIFGMGLLTILVLLILIVVKKHRAQANSLGAQLLEERSQAPLASIIRR